MRVCHLVSAAALYLLASCGANGNGPVLATDVGADIHGTDAIDVGAEVCSPNCDGKECGPNGCGGECGNCAALLEQCTEAGLCSPYDCKSSKDCPGDLVCAPDLGECVVCMGDEDCQDGEVCGADHACHNVIICTSDKQCKGSGMVCDKETGQCVECLSSAECAEEEFCFETYCLDDTCVSGQARCEGQDVFTCNPEGSGEDLSETCDGNQYCEDGACHDPVCTPDEVWCDGDVLKVCAADGKSVATEVDCEESGDFCMDDKCATCACMPGQTACLDDFTVWECSDNCMDMVQVPCPEGQSCKAGSCVVWLCDPGTVFCDGEAYKVCSSNGLVIQYEEDCSAKEQHCFNGACIDTECPPSKDFCEDDATKAHCAENGMSFTTEACPAGHYCDEGDAGVQCLPWVCSPGEAFCQDNTAKVCNGKGSAVVDEIDCGDSVCVGGACKPVICDANTSSCDGNTVMQCDATGTSLGLVETCGEGQYCGEDGNAAACADQVCIPNAKICQGTMVMQCDDVGAALGPVKDCNDEKKACLNAECVEQGCGNGAVDDDEQCDDGNDLMCDGCEGCSSLYMLDLTPENSVASTSSTPSGLAQWTVEAWVRFDNLEGDRVHFVVGHPSAFPANVSSKIVEGVLAYSKAVAGVSPDTAVRFVGYYEDASDNDYRVFSETVVQVGTWYHVAYTRSASGEQRLYVNGLLDGTSTSSAAPSPLSGPYCVGDCMSWDAILKPSSPRGLLDEVRVSDKVRYQTAFVPDRRHIADEHTVALWHFDEGQGSTIADSSANGYDLALQQGTSWQLDDCYGTSPDAAVCGDGQQAVWEDCDDGNNDGGDGCGGNCTEEGKTCGFGECPVLPGYDTYCNSKGHCEYANQLQTGWKQWDVWIFLPPGTLNMGSPNEETGHQADETPMHIVTFEDGFLISKFEAVVEQYEACLAAGKCTGPSAADWSGNGWGVNSSASGRWNHPQNGLTWQQARDFCGWVAPGGRLPSESEWEYSATGPVHRKYPWGDSPEPSCANATAVFSETQTPAGAGCGQGGTWPVGSKPGGLAWSGSLDTSGNVWEWCEDTYHSSYVGAPCDGSPWTDGSPNRSIRGGGFNDWAVTMRTAERYGNGLKPSERSAHVGARCVRPVLWGDVKTCKQILEDSPGAISGLYEVDLDGSGPLEPASAYCDMTSDGGGWTIVYAATGADGEVPLVSDTPATGSPLLFQHHNLTRKQKMALSLASSEGLFVRPGGVWLKVSHPLYDQQLDSLSSHQHYSVTLIASGGASAEGWIGYSNFNTAGGGDYNVSMTDGATCAGTTQQGVDHHSTDYYHLNCGCKRHYLFSWSNIDKDGDAGYDVYNGLGQWTATSNCAIGVANLEGGSLKFYAAMR